MEKKLCPGCQEVKSLDSFYKSSSRKDGLACWCILCTRKSGRRTYLNNTRKHREKNWRKQGIFISHDEYDKMHELQEGKCMICGRTGNASGKQLAVDHNHETGKIRGLLCTKCNTSLGWFEPRLREFIEYIERL